MNLATDRDLLILEPNIFRDVVFAPQVLLTSNDAVITGTTLTSAGSDFVSAGVDAGSVAIVNGVAVEITARLNATVLAVSRLRPADDGAALPPTPGAELSLVITSFRAQLRDAENRVRQSFGLDADGTSEAAMVLRSAGAVRLVALYAIELIYTAAATHASPRDANWQRARWYGERARAESRRVALWLDEDGDGQKDDTRRVQPTRLVRE